MQNNSTWTPSAPSLIAWPAKSWNGWLALAVVVGAIVVLFVPASVYVVAEALSGGYNTALPVTAAPNLNATLTAQVVTYLPVALYFAAILPPLSGLSLQALGLARPSARALMIGVAGCVAMFALVSIVSAVITGLTHRQDTESAIEILKALQTQGQTINFFLVAVILAPLVEELVFRVFLFNLFSRYMNVWIAMVLSGTIFGMVHALGAKELGSQLLTVGVPLSVGGFVLAYVYSVTKNYWASVTTHVVFNAIGVISVLYFHGS